MAGMNASPQQAAAVPYRRNGTGVELCLIRRWDSSFWGIPKGTIDPGDTVEETALKETWEEAGLKGRLVGDAIGTYDYEKLNVVLTVAVFLMEVSREANDWEEAHIRERRWFSLTDAINKLAGHPARNVLDIAAAKLSSLPPA